MIPPLKQHCHGIKDHHGKHNNIGQHEAGQHDKAEHTDPGRDLRRFCLEPLELLLFEVMAEHLEIQTSVVAAQYADEPSRDIRKHGRSDSALEAHQRSLIGAWVGQITFEGKHYFDDKKLLVGKLRLIELIDETDEIEKAFHTVGGGGVPEVEEIHDTEVFQYWLPGFPFAGMKGVVNSEDVAIKLDNDETEVKDKLNQLHSKIVDEFNLTKKPDIIWESKRDAFIASIRSISPAIVYIPNNANSSIPLSNSAMALLKQAANEDGIILKVSDLSVGTQIQAGTTTMNKDVSDRERAKWEGALNELISAGFVERANANGDVFNLSNSGYKMVDKKH